MKLIVGLGNPGTKYEKTRHNVGYMVLERFSMAHGLRFSNDERFFGEVARGNIKDERVILIRPRTYMNESGRAVAAVVNFFKDFGLSDIWVIHDDVDLELGRIKIQVGGGSAGHNGLNSIVESLGESEFVRFRVGIGRPLDKDISIEDYVLENFSDEEEKIFEEVLKKTILAIEMGLEKGIEKAMNEFN